MKKLPYQRFVLPNGLVVILYPVLGVRAIAFELLVKVGPRHENKKNRGISHFIEHLAHEGTAIFPTSEDFQDFLELRGVQRESKTANGETIYRGKFPARYVSEVLEVLRGQVFQPVFSDKIIETSRKVILQEIADKENKSRVVFEREMIGKRFRTENHPYSRDGVGDKNVVKKIEKKNLVGWWKKYYQPQNMILSLAGNFENETAKRIIDKIFGKQSGGESEIEEPRFSNKSYSEKNLVFKLDSSERRTTLYVSFPAFGVKTRPLIDRMALAILVRILKKSLYRELRLKEGFVYGVASNRRLFPYLGLVEIGTVTEPEKAGMVLKSIYRIIKEIQKEGIKEKELRLARSFLDAGSMMLFDSIERIVEYFGSEERLGEPHRLPEDLIKESRKISKEQVNRLLKEIFDFSKVNIGLFGQISKETELRIRDFFKI